MIVRRMMMDIRQKMQQVLREAGASKITKSAYDTSWIARLGEIDQSLSNQALNWLAENQLPDGSWGASAPHYYHDRVICTLAAMVALTKRGRRGQDRRQIERGQHALEMLNQGATRGLMTDPAGATLSFEMLMPTLLAEAESHNIVSHQDNNVLGRLTRQRRAKLAKLPEHMINRNLTIAFSAEMVGPYELQLLDMENLLEANGSVAYSPSATVFFALHVRPVPAALAFLNSLAINGAVPTTGPIHTFEYAWVLWNAGLIDNLDDETLALCQPVFKALSNVWDPKDGLGVVEGLSYKNADTTAITYQALTRFGRSVDLNGLLHYENEEHFCSCDLEANVSISTNAHALGALRQAGFEVKHPSVQKVLLFLMQAQTGRSFWFDKWHASPYYATSHAIIAAAGYADDLVTSAVEWIVNTQNEDGSWGFYAPSAEETAYCLQALAIWKRQGSGDEEISTDILKRGADWLMAHMDEPYPWLWIGKSLYCPELVVESAILSALMLVEQN
jgi:halimadienyl-diphosphate synthase